MKRLALLICLIATPVLAHDKWANNEPVPNWVKNSCCGPEDAHKLTEDMVHREKDGYRIDGYDNIIPYGHELPSQDGKYWIFYQEVYNGGHKFQSPVYCFFVPMAS